VLPAIYAAFLTMAWKANPFIFSCDVAHLEGDKRRAAMACKSAAGLGACLR